MDLARDDPTAGFDTYAGVVCKALEPRDRALADLQMASPTVEPRQGGEDSKELANAINDGVIC
jgi:hypothetical protein